ncbi:hypothetical protein A3C57_03030 [Candidatus Nomurabacteria bacterium RIFCSPHIGHO2_02_FULL_33_12]|uniref:SpoVT-AbrB domain-containing protein n=1 Tax=Candidatus Nomurabacteria bacterium RIFCSPLOWO2_01_FULL_33_17 TaxID=1801764 RepID=A0A1F6WN87_9BACT|nr:MAG: hypothetical protein A3C57_03030 [Candidatus Nomurabacteria bacterium RIFCSPHIGHO2_02_FULL_33_12]OGI83361.1 MAG: hypothetical protein A2903_01190 [Candidatus Nomurabacteria bacterium RIFCSPLOWO2_01_FULL_33_17]
MTTTIQKWGNSLGVRIPKNIVENSGFKAGGRISIFEKNGVIVLEKVLEKKSKLLDLKKVMKNCKPETYHKEVDWGQPVGKEIW